MSLIDFRNALILRRLMSRRKFKLSRTAGGKLVRIVKKHPTGEETVISHAQALICA